MTRSVRLIGLVGLLWSAGAAAAQTPAAAPAPTRRVKVFKSATCSCCSKWIAHMRAAGFVVEAQDVTNLAQVKEEHRVPVALRTCHTAMIDGYVVEGHVPADVVDALLRDRPRVTGIGVPGMPKGSPGMESPTSEHYQVLAFVDGKTTVFAER